MRIAIDAAPLLVRSAGIKNYLYHWLVHLRRAARADSIRTVPRLGELGPLHHDASVAGRWQTISGLGALAVSHYTRLPVLDWLAGDADIFHASTLTRTPPRRPRLTATIFDMTCWLMPELHSPGNLRADRAYSEILRRAGALIAISESAKADAIRVLGLAPDKIRVIYPGIAEAYFDPPAEQIDRVRTRYGLDRPYVLAVGTIEPRKNIGALARAFADLPAGLREEFELVLAGPAGWGPAETAGVVKQARYLGYVPEEALPALTAGAAVFAYPSLYEGFGFPVAQAMAAGAPVLTSDVSSLPELTGDGAVLIDPHSTAEITAGLRRLLESEGLRRDLAGRGRQRARRFNWLQCAGESLSFFTKQC